MTELKPQDAAGNTSNSPDASNHSTGGDGEDPSANDDEPDNIGPPTGNGSDRQDPKEDRDNNNDAGRDNGSDAANDDEVSSSSDDEPPRGGDRILDEPHAMPAGLFEFRTMSFEQLQTYMTDERRNDPRLYSLNPNIASWRAFLYVTVQFKHFGGASDFDCVTLWLQDTVVFTDEERGLDWIAMGMTNVIRERMNLHYGAAAPTEVDPGNVANFSDTEPESENNSSEPSESSARHNGITTLNEAQRQRFRERAQRDLATLDMTARALVRVINDQILSIDFAIEHRLDPQGDPGLQGAAGAPDDGGDGGDGSKPDSSLSWPSDFPSNPDSSDAESDSNSEGGGGCGPVLGKHPRDSDDDDPEGQSSTKKPKLGGHQASTRSSQGGGSDNADPDTRQEPSAQSPAPETNASFSSQSTIEDETTEIYIGRQLYILNINDTSIFLPFDTSRANRPMSVAELPNFARLAYPALKLWRVANPDMNLSISLGINQYTTTLAMLHMRFKRTFMHEPDENFTTRWVYDGTVFTDERREELLNMNNDLFRNGEIRRYMMEAYEPDMLRRFERLPKPRPANPKIAVQKGTFEDSESFKSDVRVGQVPVRRRRGSVDATRLSPSEARTRDGRTKYNMRERPTQGGGKRGSP
jgi:hypothetical protein